MSISLIGYMTSGKSSIGNLLANKLNFSYLDLDQIIELDTGKSINTLFNENGELYFRELEHKTLLKSIKSTNTVFSLGGGTPCYYDNITLINQSSTSFYLRGSVKTLVDRIQLYKSDRPLVKNLSFDKLKEYVAKHLFERKAYYEKAKHTIDVDNKSFEEIVNEINTIIGHN
jgi:shikimate kinase